jgi:acyl-CoA dehydrogenase
MDFSLSPELVELQQRTRAFIRDKIIPLEGDRRQTRHGPTEEFRRELVALGAAAGLLAPHVGAEYGGLGLSHVGKAVVFEEAGYSLLGPVAMHIFAPDEGNMHLLEAVASTEQKERWLRPLAAGKTRSCFCMTEPAPGAGSDPAAMLTTAVKDGNHYVINGDKWFITGADGAAFAIIMAKGEDGQATMFLADMDTPGIEIVRAMDSLDSAFAGGHAVMRFRDVRVPASDILGEPGKGFRYAQVRLAPARLTHCMRWLGAARRAHQIATDYALKREVHAGRQRNGYSHEPAVDPAHGLAAGSGGAWGDRVVDVEGVRVGGGLAGGGSLRASTGRARRYR